MELTADDLKTAAAACRFKATRVRAHADARRGEPGAEHAVIEGLWDKAQKLDDLANKLERAAR